MQQFDHRWGIPALDNDQRGLWIPGFIMRYWQQVIDRNEFAFLCEVMSYRFNCPNGQSSPAMKTLADGIGYADTRNMRRIKSGLIERGLLTVTSRSETSQTDIYDFGGFTRACLKLAEGEDKFNNTPLDNSDHTPSGQNRPPNKKKTDNKENQPTGDTSPAPASPKKRKQKRGTVGKKKTTRKRNPLFDTIALYSHKISDTVNLGAQTRQLIGRAVSAVKGNDPDVTKEKLVDFYKWYEDDEDTPDSPPCDPAKLATWYARWMQRDEYGNGSSDGNYYSPLTKRAIPYKKETSHEQ